jgi:hypothetical protein
MINIWSDMLYNGATGNNKGTIGVNYSRLKIWAVKNSLNHKKLREATSIMVQVSNAIGRADPKLKQLTPADPEILHTSLPTVFRNVLPQVYCDQIYLKGCNKRGDTVYVSEENPRETPCNLNSKRPLNDFSRKPPNKVVIIWMREIPTKNSRTNHFRVMDMAHDVY